MKPADVKQQVLMAVEAAHSKQAQNLTVLRLPEESSAFTDYFLVCSGSNPRQVQAICDEVEETLSRAGFEPNHREGYDQAEWVLLDYVDFVLHVFSENARKFYDLERLWKSAKQLTEQDLKSKRATAKKTPTPVPVKKAGRKTLPAKPAVRTGAKKAAKAGARTATKSAARTGAKSAAKKVSTTRTQAKAAASRSAKSKSKKG